MYQPSAPCSPPSTKMPASLGASARGICRRARNQRNGTANDDADEPAPQAVDIFPEEDALEVGERHAGVDRVVLRDRLVALEFGRPLRLVERREHARDRLPLA